MAQENAGRRPRHAPRHVGNLALEHMRALLGKAAQDGVIRRWCELGFLNSVMISCHLGSLSPEERKQ